MCEHVCASGLCRCFKGEFTPRPRPYKGRQRGGKHFQLRAVQTQSRQMLGRVEHIHTTTASKMKATKNAKTHSDAKLTAQTPGFHLHTAGPKGHSVLRFWTRQILNITPFRVIAVDYIKHGRHVIHRFLKSHVKLSSSWQCLTPSYSKSKNWQQGGAWLLKPCQPSS